jgi:nucleoside-diphosphate-sugar epimerase
MELRGKTMAITGVGGFIGLRMAVRARERGMTVRGIDVSPEAAARAETRGAEVVVGDVCDEAALTRAFEGADVVLHTAACVSEDGDLDSFRRVNVGGTLCVGRVARKLSVPRLVHLSSVMVYGFDYAPEVDEDGPLRGEQNAYCQTKIESDFAALAMNDPAHFRSVVLRPGDVYGPGCPSWVTRPVALLKRGLFALPHGGRGIINHLHVDNLIDAVFLVLERELHGRAFNVTDGAVTTCAEFFGHYARMLGKRRPLSLPAPLMHGAFSALDTAANLLGKQVPAQPVALRYLSRPHAYSIERARWELGYVPRISLAEGMEALETWLRSEGLLNGA